MSVGRTESVISFGDWVRRQRKALDLTQAALAGRVGCAKVTIKKIERDERRPSPQMAERLADCLALPQHQRAHFVRMARGEFVVAEISPWAAVEAHDFKHNLAPQPTPFVGREKELAGIARCLQDADCRLLTLVGPGGIGKTRLATQAAQNLIDTPSKRAAFAHGVIHVSLAPVSSLGGTISAIAEAANCVFYTDVSPRQQLLDYLREKRMLLVLDNYEHLTAHVNLLAEILATAPAVKILVTSREALHLQQAWFHPVEGMSFPQEGDGDGEALEECDAVRLFLQCARRARPGFTLAAEGQAVARICRLVEGMPLAIELAAAWLKMLSCAQIAVEIERNLGFLAAQLVDVPERHRSMRAVFERSWQLLSEAERDTLKGLSVFRGDFHQEAAERVAGASLMVLRTLVEKSLLRPADAGRYQLHELLRQFAVAKFQADVAEKAATEERHSDYYLAFLQAREGALQGRGQQKALDEIGREIKNVRSGWNWAIEQGQADAVDRSLESLYHFYQIQSRYQEGEETFGRAAAHLEPPAGRSDRRSFETLRMKILARWGAFYGFLGLAAPAREHLGRSLAAARKLGHVQETAFCLALLGKVAGWQGQYARAKRLLEESLAISREMDDRQGMAYTLYNLAEVVQFLGSGSKARRLAEESLAISRELGRRDWIAHALDRLGFSTFTLGAYAESERYYRESLATFEEIGGQLGMSLALGGLALIARAVGGTELACAEAWGQRSLALARDCGHRFHIATRLGILGSIADSRGKLEEAQQKYREGLAIAQALDAAQPMTRCLGCLGDVHRQLGDLQASKKYLLEALRTGVDSGVLVYTLQVLVYYAAFLVQENDVLDKRQRQIQALELVALVLHHPVTWQVYRDRAARLRTRLEAELGPEVAVAAWERGKSRTLEDTVRGILGEILLPDRVDALDYGTKR